MGGESGVSNPDIIDIVMSDDAAGEVILIMVETRPWSDLKHRAGEIQAKANTYVAYALDGALATAYPEFVGLDVRIQLDTIEPPPAAMIDYLSRLENEIERHGVRFSWSLLPTGEPG